MWFEVGSFIRQRLISKYLAVNYHYSSIFIRLHVDITMANVYVSYISSP